MRQPKVSLLFALVFTLLSGLLFTLVTAKRPAPTAQSSREPAFKQRLHAARKEIVGEAGGKPNQAWFYRQRAYPAETIPFGARQDAVKRWEIEEARIGELRKRGAAAVSATAAQNAWLPLGPQPILNGQTFGPVVPVAGRVTAIALDPRYDGVTNQTLYVAGAQGGVWRSTDNGANWTPIFDDQPSLAIGAIAVDPTNPNVIWAGTGEPNFAGDSYYGAGLFKTTNGGATWKQIVGPLATTDPRIPSFLNCAFSKIEIDPQAPATVYVTTAVGVFASATSFVGIVPLGNRGLYKTTDGGANWVNITPDWKTRTIATDVALDPRNSNRVYVALLAQGIYRSDNRGDFFTWKKLTRGLPVESDDPKKTTFTRIALTLGPPIGSSANATIYAAYAGADDNLLGIFRSIDNGESWTKVTTPQLPGQASYNLALACDPNNGNIVYYGTSANAAYEGGVVHRTIDAGISWEDITFGLHPDTHALVVSAANSNIVFTGNDGGIWRTDNARERAVTGGGGGGNGSLITGVRWRQLNDTLSLTQFQSLALHPSDPTILLGGTQDNGTNRYHGQPAWLHVDDGDGGAALIDQSNPNVAYHTYFNVTGYFTSGAVIGPAVSFDGGNSWEFRGCFGCGIIRGNFNPNDRVAFYAPMAQNTAYTGNTGNVIYFGTYRLYRSADRATTWLGVGESSDGFGKDVTRGQGVITAIAAFPAKGTIDRPGEIVWTGTSDGMISVTSNADALGNARFNNVTRTNLPNRFITDIALDPTNANRAVVTFSGFGTNTPARPGHVFLTTDFGANWRDITGNLPDVPANSVAIDPHRANTYYLGTDIGVFQTVDGGTTWVRLGLGMPRVATVVVRYHALTGSIIASTHGRGMFRLPVNPGTVATVSAASFRAQDLAREGIVATFGAQLAARTEAANRLPLPTTLADTRVLVRDSAGSERLAPLFFVSPTQINYQIPLGTSPGRALITVSNTSGSTSFGEVVMNHVAPSLFTANADGAGVPVGVLFRVRNGATTTETIATASGNRFVPTPIDLGPTTDQVVLTLFGTGFRFRSAISAVSATIGGRAVQVSFAGAQGQLAGLDQLNLLLPRTLTGLGEVDLVLTVEGKTANVVRVNIR